MFREGFLKVRFKVGEYACNNLNAKDGVMNKRSTGKIYFICMVGSLFALLLLFFYFIFFLPLLAHISEATETPFVKCQEHGELRQKGKSIRGQVWPV